MSRRIASVANKLVRIARLRICDAKCGGIRGVVMHSTKSVQQAGAQEYAISARVLLANIERGLDSDRPLPSEKGQWCIDTVERRRG